MMLLILLALANLSLVTWVYLFMGRGFFWRTGQRLTVAPSLCGDSGSLPSVAVLVPARNEAGLLAQTLPQLLLQDYSGRFHVWLVDDSSTDGTAEVARRVARDLGTEERLSVIMADPLTPGWTGKLWALQQGVQAALTAQPEYLLFVDADIALAPGVLQALVKKAMGDGLHLVSVMALLKLLTGWERMLVPAFVYFFMLLYPAGNAAGVLVVPGRGCRRLVPVGLRRRCRSRSVAAGRQRGRVGFDEYVLPACVAVVPGFSHAGLAAARYCRCLHVDDHPFGVAILARPGQRLEGAHFTAVNLNPRCEIGRRWPIMGAAAAPGQGLAANIRRRLK